MGLEGFPFLGVDVWHLLLAETFDRVISAIPQSGPRSIETRDESRTRLQQQGEDVDMPCTC